MKLIDSDCYWKVKSRVPSHAAITFRPSYPIIHCPSVFLQMVVDFDWVIVRVEVNTDVD